MDDELDITEVTPSLPGMEVAFNNPLDESQLLSKRARAIFEQTGDADPWMQDYWDLIAEGWPWRQAVYMLWAAQPKDARVPRTQRELATKILGLTGDRAIRKWRQNPAFEARVARLVASVVGQHRANVLAALIASASDPHPRAHADRKLFLEMSGDYVPAMGLNVRDGVKATEQLSSDELEAVAGAPEVPIIEVAYEVIDDASHSE